MDIKVTLNTEKKAKPQDESKLGFGKIFTDHMFIMEYEAGKGWMNPRIEPYHALALDPASTVLHYGQEIFEGLKAYRAEDDRILMFRAKDNCRRLNRSADRMCMPEIDVDFNFKAMQMLVDIERDWVPHSEGTSLYLRPTMIANDIGLGVHAAKHYVYYVICAPSGAYYPQGLAPIKIRVEDRYIRAVEGGTGEAKTGGNYAASIKAGDEAEAQGYAQVLWLDGAERKYIEEVGAMNMMFVIDDTLVTAALHGSILPGITRDSVLTLAREMGLKVEERKLSVDELMDAARTGRLKEAFGTGTAAVVSPVGWLTYKDETVQVQDGGIGELTMKFYNTLTSIQWGKSEDTHDWVSVVPEFNK
ncbi:MAG: branched-chain amino acid aminotransferase [Clostridia bacterium]|nr:branched-chain amino acid aminotransferase [Clostridia bacterium]